MDRPTKPSLVMIHGLIGSLDYFDPGERIGEARVTTPDLLGYGSRTGVPTRGLTLAGQAEHVVEPVRTLPEETVWLLGHSMAATRLIVQRSTIIGAKATHACPMPSMQYSLSET